MYFHDFMCEIEESVDKEERLKAILKLCDIIAKGGAYNLDRLLACLFRSNDCYFNSRLFLLLAYIASQNSYHKLKLIRNRKVYEHAFQSLSNNSLAKTIGVIRYFTALLSSDSESDNTVLLVDHRYLAIAQNSIRVTSCLAQLCQFFLNDAISADLWRPLCLCLAECCRGSSLNQSQASQLLCKCVELLARPQSESELLTLVQSLVDSHSLNCKRFVQLGGMKCFTRDNLQRVEGLHLLCSVVDGYSAALTAACQQNIPDIVKEVSSVKTSEKKFLHWCSLAMWHLHGKLDNPDDKQYSSDGQLNCSTTEGPIKDETNINKSQSQNVHVKKKNTSPVSLSQIRLTPSDINTRSLSIHDYVKKYELIRGIAESDTQNTKLSNTNTTRCLNLKKNLTSVKCSRENHIKCSEISRQTKMINSVISRNNRENTQHKSGSDYQSKMSHSGSVFDSSDEFDSFVGDDPPNCNTERSIKMQSSDKFYSTLSNTERTGNNCEHNLQSRRAFITNDEDVQNYNSISKVQSLRRVSNPGGKLFHRFDDILQLRNANVSVLPSTDIEKDIFKRPRERTFLLIKNNQLQITPIGVPNGENSNEIEPAENIKCISGGFPGRNTSEFLHISIDDDFLPLCSSTPKKSNGKKAQMISLSQENAPENRSDHYHHFGKTTAAHNSNTVKRPHTVICRNQSIQTDDEDSSTFTAPDTNVIYGSCNTHNRSIQNMKHQPDMQYKNCNASSQHNSKDNNNNIHFPTAIAEHYGNQDIKQSTSKVESAKCTLTAESHEPPRKFLRVINGNILDTNISPKQNLRSKTTAEASRIDHHLGSRGNCVELNVSLATLEDALQTSACKTCEDTKSLKLKLESNEYLRKTVKKLRIGIAMYGCNFKKIADVLWAEDESITSNVLYGLFRKVIMQK